MGFSYAFRNIINCCRQSLRKRLTGESLPPSCSVRTGPRSRCARLHSAARDPFGIPHYHRGLLRCIATELFPSRFPQFGLHSVVYSYNATVPRSMVGINQYATPNRNIEDRDSDAVPAVLLAEIAMKRSSSKASLRGGRCHLRQQMTEGVTA